jgi:hypothetical protein
MQASSKRTGQVRLALMLILGVAAAAACVVTLMLWKAPAASGQETTPTEASFVVLCRFSYWDQIDPIYPSPPTYQREFFANTNRNTTAPYAELLKGPTNCDDPKDTARYWIPRVFWNGKALTASITRFYYRLGEKSPDVTVKPHPAGLKIDTEPGKNVEWRCMNTGAWSTTPPAQCSNGKLVVRIKFPDCSNGQLDSVDHRSHMAFAQVPANGGKATCPTSHPIPVPRLQTNVEFPIPPGTPGTPTLSTASGTSGAYSTMHSAFFNAWDQQRLQRLVNRCINAAPFTNSNPKPTVCL